MLVLLAGEGSDDLGGWAAGPGYREDPVPPGIIEALLLAAGLDGWEIRGAVAWRSIRKYKPGQHRGAETRNVLGAALLAQESGCDALVFVRDRDGDPEREDAVERGIREAASHLGIRIAGGIAREEIDAWLLALLGHSASESHADAKAELERCSGITDRQAKLDVIRREAIDRMPADAHSLRAWLGRAAVALG